MCAAVLVLAGCGGRVETAHGPTDAAGDGAPQSAGGLTRDLRQMVDAVPGSGSAPIELKFDLGAHPIAGQPFEMQLAVVAKAPAPIVRVEVTADSGLTVVQPAMPVTLEKVEEGAPAWVPVRLKVATPGTLLIRIGLTMESPTGSDTRTFLVPVLVGDRRD